MSAGDHERWKDQVAAYLLGTLGPDEAAELERHVAGCRECERELSWLRPAVDRLAEGVEPAVPSPDLRQNVIAAVRADLERAAPRRERRPLFTGWRPGLALAAAVLVLGALAGYALRDGGSGEPPSTTVAAAGEAGMRATVVSSGGSATLRLANVEAMPSDRVLQAWVKREGGVEAVSTLFVPDRHGRATTMIPDMEGVEAVMVTSEPRGGSERPTSPPLVTARIEPG